MSDNSLATFETKTLIVIEEESGESRRTQANENGMSIHVAVNAHAKRFGQLFWTR